MEPTNNTKLIEQYLANELSSEQKNAFENALSQDAALQKEVAQQIAIHEGAQRANTRVQIKKVAKSYHFYKNIVTLSVIVAIMGAAGILGYFLLKENLETSNKENRINPTLLDQLASKAPIDNLQSDFFTWNGSDSVIISKNGVLLSIPKDALLLDGKPYNEQAIIQWQEALDAPTIMKSGLSTTSNGKLLETQGMFGLEAYTKDGKKLSVNPNVGIYVQVPVDQYKKGMQLFKGEKDKTGMINWVNPTPLQKIPVPVDMKDLNFYPKGYEDTLNKLKLPRGRKYRDSLYASLEEGNSLGKLEFTINKSYVESPIDNMSINKINDYRVKINFNQMFFSTNDTKIVEYTNKKDILKDEGTLIGDIETKVKTLIDSTLRRKYGFSGNELNDNYAYSANIIQRIPNISYTLKILGYELKGNFENGILKLNEKDKGFINQMKTGTPFSIEYKIDKNEIFVEWDINFKRKSDKLFVPFLLIYKNSQNMKLKSIGTNIININCSTVNSNHIPPSKVLSFWNKKFNNTNLATREFEARMKEIHPTCKAEVLALYVNNLNKNISDIDHQVVNIGYTTFEEFAKEQVGALNPNNPHLNSLIKFYDQTAKEISEKTSQLIAKQLKREKVFDSELAQSRMKETDRAILRKVQASNEEYELNLNNVYKQLGKEKSSIRQITNKTIGVTIINSGVYNIDKYVMDATVSRTSTVITDPETGKTAKITYNDFSFQVKSANKYPKLFAYLFPSKLNTYQRISGTNGSFTYPLNDDIVYHLAILGINEDGFFYYEQKNLKEGKLGEIVLEKLSEKEMDQRIDALNESRGIIKPMKIKDELGWLVKEQKYYVETKRRMEHDGFVRRMKRVVFPCYREGEEGSATEEIADDPFKK
jgi:hypothetical protein